MSELVEKTARAIASAYHDVNGCAPGTLNRTEALDAVEQFWPDYKPEARAAVAAVAEWMIDEFSYQAEMIEIKQAIAAALRAAAGGGDK